MGSIAKICEVIEDKEEQNSFRHFGHIYHSSSGFSFADKDLEHPVLKLGYTSSLEDDINQLFESINMRTSSKGTSHSHQADTSSSLVRSASSVRSSGLKKPNAIEMPHPLGIGASEMVSLNEALRDLHLSKASEMAALKQTLKIIGSPRISEAARIKGLHNPVMVESVNTSRLSYDEPKRHVAEMPLMLDESKSYTFGFVPQQFDAPKKTSPNENVWNPAAPQVHYKNGITPLSNGIHYASGKAENQELKSRKVDMPMHLASHYNGRDDAWVLAREVASLRSTNDKATSKSIQKKKSYNLPSSTSVNGRTTSKSTRNAARLSKPILRNKISVKKKLKHGSNFNIRPTYRYDGIDGIFDPVTNQLLCHRCHCALKKANSVYKQDSLTPLNASHTTNATSNIIESCKIDVDMGIHSESIASSNTDDNVEVILYNVGSSARDDSKGTKNGSFATPSFGSYAEVRSFDGNSDVKIANKEGNKNLGSLSNIGLDVERGLTDMKFNTKDVVNEDNKDILVRRNTNLSAKLTVGQVKYGNKNASKEVYSDSRMQPVVGNNIRNESDDASLFVRKPNISDVYFSINRQLVGAKVKDISSQRLKYGIGEYSNASISQENNQDECSLGIRHHMQHNVAYTNEVKVGEVKSLIKNVSKEVEKDTRVLSSISRNSENASCFVQKPEIAENHISTNGQLVPKDRDYITTREKGEPSQRPKDDIEYNRGISKQSNQNSSSFSNRAPMQHNANHNAEAQLRKEKSSIQNDNGKANQGSHSRLKNHNSIAYESYTVSFFAQKPNTSRNHFDMNGHLNGKDEEYITTREKGEPSKSSKESVGESSNTTSVSEDSNQSRSRFNNRPHMSKDVRWEAIQHVRMQQGVLTLRHFNLLKKLGCGDIGTVYLAELVGTNCLFAIKVMDNEFLERRKKMSRAQIERDILKMLDHPFLPTLYAHFISDDLSCLVMEYCPGGDLHVLRQKQPGRRFLEPAARFYVAEVLLAMEYLHMLGVIYRDLKPENILVHEDGHIMVTDFDLSIRSNVSPTLLKSSSSSTIDSIKICGRATESSCTQPIFIQPSSRVSCFGPKLLSNSKRSKSKKSKKVELISQFKLLPQLVAEPTDARSNSFVGTHEYLAPEIIKGDGHGSAVDWWTFGIFLYELLYGKTPFKGTTNEETLANVALQSLKFPDSPPISFQAKDLIRELLTKDPKNRLGSIKGAADIKRHPFFAGLNWALIRCAIPPELPNLYEFGVSSGVVAENKKNYLECKPTKDHIEFELF